MRYKIPINIEEADKILFGLSFIQMIVIAPGMAIAYFMYNALQGDIATTPLLMICGFIVGIFVFIAIFKSAEMNFLEFVLNQIRLFVTQKKRHWSQGVDAFPDIEIGYTTIKKKKDTESKSRHERFSSIEDTIHKI